MKNPRRNNSTWGTLRETRKPGLALHLGLEDFSGQAGHSRPRWGDIVVVVDGNAVLVCGNAIRCDGDAILFGRGLATGGDSFNLDAQLALELKEIRALFPQKECGSNAAFSGAACAADAMDEIFGDVGKIIVDDVGDVLDVNAASGDVGGDKDAILPALEAGEGRGALRLRAVAMNHGGVDALAVEALGDAFGARENKAAAAFVVEQVEEHIGLAVFRDLEGLETNTFRGFRGGAE